MSQHPGSNPESTSSDTSVARATWPPDLSVEAPRGGTIGDYRLIEQIGSGGMGVVYKAEQLRPVRRIVALKLIKLGMDTPQVVARFQSERQALAMLEHPGIARVYDAGATDTGRPYFVMEYVPGQPITDYCDSRGLTTVERLKLFEQACHAVQHGHYKGILHRDLKPSNILVAEIDGAPQPKVIDFGVAKATQESTGATLATCVGQLVGTPVYMSPEQATGGDVDTRADVYSLGVVLFELLSGAMPFDPGSFAGADSLQIVRKILETDPPRPSTRVSSSGLRGVDQPTLRRQLRGDLDRIVLKAIAKDRSQRYGTAAALAEDVRRHLAHEPILARPPTLSYQARKFTRRNRVLVGASAVVLLAIMLGGVAATIGLVRARQALARETQARQAEQASRLVAESVTEFLRDMLASVNPKRAQGSTVLVRDVLDRASAELPARFHDQPVVASRLHSIMSDTYDSLSLFEPSLTHAKAALELCQAALGADHPGTLAAEHSLAVTLRKMGRNNEAEVLLRDVLDRRRRVDGPEELETLLAEEALALVLLGNDRAADAEMLQRHSLESRRRLFGDDHTETLTAMHNLAPIVQALGRMDECESLYRASSEGRLRMLGPNHPATLIAQNNLAAIMVRQDRLAEAEPILRDVLERSERVLGKDHKSTLECANNLAYLLQSADRPSEAEALYRELLTRLRRTLPENHRNTLVALSNLARTLEAQQKAEEALQYYAELYQRALVAELPPAAVVRYTAPYGLRLVKFGRFQEAETPLLEARRRIEAANLSDGSSLRDVLTALAQVCEQTNRGAQAERFRAEAARIRPASTMPATQPSP